MSANVITRTFATLAETFPIRIVELDGKPWFVAVDVCHALGFNLSAGAAPHMKKMAHDERRVLKAGDLPKSVLGSAPSIAVISESGLYKLIMRSDKPEARRFQDWVTRDVLPAIRKDGAYIMGEEKVATGEMDEDAFIQKAYEMLKRKVERLAQEKERLALENKKMATKAVVFDNCVALRKESLTTFVRTLNGINTMAIKRDLADQGYLYRSVETNQYRVHAKYRDTLFIEKLKVHPARPYYQIIPTAEGKKLIVQLYQEGKLTMRKSFAA
ncbi:Bro-N domain-containing protein [Pseudomonas sp. C11]|uniref:BRO-N domain-containing protein n=1 Tax=Pseudomonas sp. C11 TaxID=3075550 RepID=UPI002AFE77A5|nr:BRO family protein [Pseudomonas sp. C11]